MLQANRVTDTPTYLRFPSLPAPPKDVDFEWYSNLQQWYADLTRLLQRDREEILAKIKQLS